jgi:GntR family transcriptional regulator of gluconate operon
VREALLALEQEGLVSGVPYAGYHVNRLSGRDVRELFEMRALLETYALEHPDEAVRASVIERLEASIKGMSEASKNGDQEGFIAGDVAFHRAVVSLASNSLVESLWVLMTPRVRLFMSGEDQLADDLCAVADSHWTIVEAMKVKDFKKAQTALREHLHLCSKVLGTDGAARDSD